MGPRVNLALLIKVTMKASFIHNWSHDGSSMERLLPRVEVRRPHLHLILLVWKNTVSVWILLRILEDKRRAECNNSHEMVNFNGAGSIFKSFFFSMWFQMWHRLIGWAKRSLFRSLVTSQSDLNAAGSNTDEKGCCALMVFSYNRSRLDSSLSSHSGQM